MDINNIDIDKTWEFIDYIFDTIPSFEISTNNVQIYLLYFKGETEANNYIRASYLIDKLYSLRNSDKKNLYYHYCCDYIKPGWYMATRVVKNENGEDHYYFKWKACSIKTNHAFKFIKYDNYEKELLENL